MSTPTKTPFQSIDHDAIDKELDAFAAKRGIAATVHPSSSLPKGMEDAAEDPEWAEEVAAARAERERQGSATVTKLPTAAAPAAPATPKRTKPKRSPATPPDDWERHSMNFPRYVADQLHSLARKERATIQYIVMLALKEHGITINDADLIRDGRRKE